MLNYADQIFYFFINKTKMGDMKKKLWKKTIMCLQGLGIQASPFQMSL